VAGIMYPDIRMPTIENIQSPMNTAVKPVGVKCLPE
jgi:hypothetical protein